jgi:cell wall-associated NlpC family hydrolase
MSELRSATACALVCAGLSGCLGDAAVAAALPAPGTPSPVALIGHRAEPAGAVKITLRCLLPTRPCRAQTTLSAGAVTIGRRVTWLAPRRTASLVVGLSRAGRKLAGTRHLTRARLRVQATVAGGSVSSADQLVSLIPPVLGPTGDDVIRYARRFMGTPYLYGGDGPQMFDCSGFTRYVYARFGYHLSRTAYEQMHEGRAVSGPLQPGDLVIWDGGGHVGMYTGRTTFISATVHRGIWVYSFATWSQAQSYTTARRILGTPPRAGLARAARGLPRNGRRDALRARRPGEAPQPIALEMSLIPAPRPPLADPSASAAAEELRIAAGLTDPFFSPPTKPPSLRPKPSTLLASGRRRSEDSASS